MEPNEPHCSGTGVWGRGFEITGLGDIIIAAGTKRINVASWRRCCNRVQAGMEIYVKLFFIFP